MMSAFEIAWEEITRSGNIVTKRRAFKTPEARENFIDKLIEKDSFYRILAYLNP